LGEGEKSRSDSCEERRGKGKEELTLLFTSGYVLNELDETLDEALEGVEEGRSAHELREGHGKLDLPDLLHQ